MRSNRKMKKDPEKLLTRIQLILFVLFLFLWFISPNNPTLRTIGIGIFGAFSILQSMNIVKRKKLCIGKPIYLYILFAFWGVLSVLWAQDSNATLDRAFDLVCNVIFLIISYDFFIHAKINKATFISTFIIVGLAFSIYILSYYGISNYFSMLTSGRRVGREIINVNFIGLISTTTFILIIYSVLNKIYSHKLMLLSAIIPLITALGSGSRKALIGLAIGSILVFLFYMKGRMSRKKIVISVLIVLAAILTINIIKTVPYFETIFNRTKAMMTTLNDESTITDQSTYTRKQYIEEGLKTFLNHPITGIGLNNSGYITKEISGQEAYLHCNYVELLACVGIVGFLLYYCIYLMILKKALKSSIKLPIIMIIILLIIEIGAVTYYEIKTTMHFILILILLEKQNWIHGTTREHIMVPAKLDGETSEDVDKK